MKLQVENRLEKFPYSLEPNSNLFKTKTKFVQDIKGNDILRRKKITVLRGRGLSFFQHVLEASSCKGSWGLLSILLDCTE